MAHIFINDRFVSEMKLIDVCCESLGSSHNLARINFHQNDRAEHTKAALKGLSKIISKWPDYLQEFNSHTLEKLNLTLDSPEHRQFEACDQNQPIL